MAQSSAVLPLLTTVCLVLSYVCAVNTVQAYSYTMAFLGSKVDDKEQGLQV
jgi:hypothetical protein